MYRVTPTPPCPSCRGLMTPTTSGAPFTIVTGLTPGQAYTFVVRGTNAAGTGPPSEPSRPIKATRRG